MTKHTLALHLAVAALRKYADPESYRMILVWDGPGAGWIAGDLGHPNAEGIKPFGKLARETLSKIDELLNGKGS